MATCDAVDLKVQLQTLLEQMGQAVSGKIDSKIAAALDLANVDIDTLKAKVAALETVLDADPSTPEYDQAQNIITQLADLLAQINEMKDPAVAGSLANQIAGVAADLQTLTDTINGLSGRVGGVETAVNNVAASLGVSTDAVDGTVQGLNLSYSTIKQAAVETLKLAEQNKDRLDVLTASAATTGSIANQLATLDGTLRQYIDDRIANVDLSALEGRVSANETAIAGLEQRMQTAEGSLTQLGTDLSTLAGRVSDNESAVSDLQTAVTGLTSRVTANEQAVATLDSRVTANEQCVATMYSELSTVASGIADLLNSFQAGLNA